MSGVPPLCAHLLPLRWPQGRGGEGLEASLHHILPKCSYSESEEAGLVALHDFTVGVPSGLWFGLRWLG